MATEKRLGRLGTMTEASVYARVAKTNNLDYAGNLPTMTNIPSEYSNITKAKERELDNDIVADGGNLPCDCDPDPKTYTFDAPLFNKSGAIQLLLDGTSPLTVNGSELSIDLSGYATKGMIPDISQFVKQSTLDLYALKSDLSVYAKLSDIPNLGQMAVNTTAITKLQNTKADKAAFGALAFKSQVQIADIATKGTGSANTVLMGDGSWYLVDWNNFVVACQLQAFLTKEEAEATYMPKGSLDTNAMTGTMYFGDDVVNFDFITA